MCTHCIANSYSHTAKYLYVATFHMYSGAILRYLAAKYQVPDHWYPSKLEDCARVDECLEWTDSNMRAGASGYFFNKVLTIPS